MMSLIAVLSSKEFMAFVRYDCMPLKVVCPPTTQLMTRDDHNVQSH